jgi:hypothetical protein
MLPFSKDASVSGPTTCGSWRGDRTEGLTNTGTGLSSNFNPTARQHIRRLPPGGTGPDTRADGGRWPVLTLWVLAMPSATLLPS